MRLNFYCPTKIFFGIGVVSTHRDQLTQLGKKAIIVTGGNSSKINGSLEDMMSALNSVGIDYRVFDQVEQNPSVKTVFDAAEIARDFKADFVIGIGGGSPLDAAKAVAVMAVNNITEQQLMAHQWTNSPLPIVVVPTTAGTGTEVTRAAVLTVDWAETKLTIFDDALYPTIAFLDASYTDKLPWRVTINTAVDALSHGIEAFLSKKSTVFSDLIAMESISLLAQLLRSIKKDHISLPEREELLYASLLAGLAISQTSTGVIHALGYSFTYYKGLPHGLANGILTAPSLEFLAQAAPEKVESIVEMLECNSIHEIDRLLRRVLEPVENIKLTPEEQKLFVQRTMELKNIDNCIERPTEEDIMQILIRGNFI